jgi:hypothetical protein
VRYPARVLRQAGAEARRVARADTQPHSRLRDRLAMIALVTLGVDFICALLAYMFEHDEHGTQVKSFGSALFWTSTQLLTVSSQMPNPISTPGRILDVFMEAWAVVVVASLAAAIGAFLVKRVDDLAEGHEPSARRDEQGATRGGEPGRH